MNQPPMKGHIIVVAIPVDHDAPIRARLIPIADAKKAAEAALATGRYARVIEATPFRESRKP